MILIYALAALGSYVAFRWLRNEFKPKPSYSPLFRLWDRSDTRPLREGQ